MKVTILLADSAQAVGGKLYILGGGWSIIRSNPTPTALAIKVEVPWNEANTRHELQLILCDEDGQPVRIPGKDGDQIIEIKNNFEVGRPPGLRAGTPLDFVMAINIAPLPLRPDSRYVWHCSINGQTDEHWQTSFATSSQPLAAAP